MNNKIRELERQLAEARKEEAEQLSRDKERRWKEVIEAKKKYNELYEKFCDDYPGECIKFFGGWYR